MKYIVFGDINVGHQSMHLFLFVRTDVSTSLGTEVCVCVCVCVCAIISGTKGAHGDTRTLILLISINKNV